MSELPQANEQITPLTEDHEAVIRAGLAAHQRVRHELEQARAELDVRGIKIHNLETEIESLKRQLERSDEELISTRNSYEARCAALQLERDQAVADRAMLEAFFEQVRTLMSNVGLPVPVRHRAERREGNGSSFTLDPEAIKLAESPLEREQ